MFEIFNRLNSGGVNLSAQELRMSLYDSAFLRRLLRMNRKPSWRRLLQREELDVRFKDVEILLRSFALLLWIDEYRPSMVKFLNRFARHCQQEFNSERVDQLERLFDEFLEACSNLPDRVFMVNGSSRFNMALFEVVFAEILRARLGGDAIAVGTLRPEDISAIDRQPTFREALQEGTTKPEKVRARLQSAKNILVGKLGTMEAPLNPADSYVERLWNDLADLEQYGHVVGAAILGQYQVSVREGDDPCCRELARASNPTSTATVYQERL